MLLVWCSKHLTPDGYVNFGLSTPDNFGYPRRSFITSQRIFARRVKLEVEERSENMATHYIPKKYNYCRCQLSYQWVSNFLNFSWTD